MNRMLVTMAAAMLLMGAAARAGEAPKFTDVDKNKDGYVSHEEAAMAPEIMKLFATVDANHDNRLSQTEYENAVKQLKS
jgi:EF hand